VLKSLLIGLLSLTLAAPTLAHARKLYPVDEGRRDPSFSRFRQKLIQAARRRDRRYIWRITDPKIECSFGEENGKKAFRRMWTERPAGELEQELIALLSLGGEFEDKRTFCAPYVWTRFPQDLEGVDWWVVTGRNVRVRQRPDAAAPVLTTLSYEIVNGDYGASVPAGADRKQWVKITTPSGKPGYVSGRFIRNVIDHRAWFERRRGKWWMTVMIAGD
jgi:hypothetical protein